MDIRDPNITQQLQDIRHKHSTSTKTGIFPISIQKDNTSISEVLHLVIISDASIIKSY